MRQNYGGMKECHTYEGMSNHVGVYVKVVRVCQSYEGLSKLRWFFKVVKFVNLIVICQTYEGVSQL